MYFARDDGLVFVEILLQLDLIDGGIDVGHEHGVVIFVVSIGAQDHIVFVDFDCFEILKDAVCHFRRCEDDGTFPTFQSDFLSEFALFPEMVIEGEF